MFARSVSVSFYATLLIAMVTNVQAENWPNWRGPAANGVSSETGLPVTWSAEENIAWKAQFRGLGISSPIVWDDRVFVTSQIGGGESRSGPRLFQGEACLFAATTHYGPSGRRQGMVPPNSK
jgi:hypothetical protein